MSYPKEVCLYAAQGFCLKKGEQWELFLNQADFELYTGVVFSGSLLFLPICSKEGK